VCIQVVGTAGSSALGLGGGRTNMNSSVTVNTVVEGVGARNVRVEQVTFNAPKASNRFNSWSTGGHARRASGKPARAPRAAGHGEVGRAAAPRCCATRRLTRAPRRPQPEGNSFSDVMLSFDNMKNALADSYAEAKSKDDLVRRLQQQQLEQQKKQGPQ